MKFHTYLVVWKCRPKFAFNKQILFQMELNLPDEKMLRSEIIWTKINDQNYCLSKKYRWSTYIYCKNVNLAVIYNIGAIK